MPFLIETDFGAGYIDITNHCSVLRRKRSAHNNELRPTVNTVYFNVTDLTIANLFFSTTDDINIRIKKDGTDWFRGKIRSNFELTMTSAFDGMSIECVDKSSNLREKIEDSFSWLNYKICDPSSTSTSLIHQLLIKAGFTLGEMDLTEIDVTIPVYVVERQENKIFLPELSQIMFEYGFVLDMGYDGVFVMHEMHPTSLSTSALIDSDTAHNRSTKRKLATYEAVRVEWNPIETIENALVFTDRTNSDDINPCNITIADGEYYPPESGTEDVFSIYRFEDGEILNTANAYLSWAQTGVISLQSQTFEVKRALIKFLGVTSGVLRKFRIYGDVTFRDFTKVNKSVVYRVINSRRILELKTRFIYEKIDGDKLASNLANYYDFSRFSYRFDVVDPDFPIEVNQQFHLVSVAQNITTDIRVVHLTEDEWGKRHARCEGISAYSPLSAEVQDILNSPESTRVDQTISFIQGEIDVINAKEEYFEYPAENAFLNYWQDYSGSGEITFLPGGLSGNQNMQIGNNAGNDQRWLISKTNIPYNPETLYSINTRIRRLVGTGSIFVGVAGVAADGETLVDTTGVDNHFAQHYFAASAQSPSDWTDYTGYFKGSSPSGNGGQHNTFNDPGTMHSDTRYLRMLIGFNYLSQPGRSEIDFIRLEEDRSLIGMSDTATAGTYVGFTDIPAIPSYTPSAEARKIKIEIENQDTLRYPAQHEIQVTDDISGTIIWYAPALDGSDWKVGSPGASYIFEGYVFSHSVPVPFIGPSPDPAGQVLYYRIRRLYNSNTSDWGDNETATAKATGESDLLDNIISRRTVQDGEILRDALASFLINPDKFDASAFVADKVITAEMLAEKIIAQFISATALSFILDPVISGSISEDGIDRWGISLEITSTFEAQIVNGLNTQVWKIDNDGNEGVITQSFPVDPNGIYEIKCLVKKASNFVYVGLWTGILPPSPDPYIPTGNALPPNALEVDQYLVDQTTGERTLISPATSAYFNRYEDSAGWKEVKSYLIGHGRSVTEIPKTEGIGNAWVLQMKDPNTRHACIRILNWDNDVVSVPLYVAQVSVTKLGAGSVLAEQIFADTVLLNTARSLNYIAGLSGWKIDKTGIAEFLDIIARGEIEANNGKTIFQDTGLISYSRDHDDSPQSADTKTILSAGEIAFQFYFNSIWNEFGRHFIDLATAKYTITANGNGLELRNVVTSQQILLSDFIEIRDKMVIYTGIQISDGTLISESAGGSSLISGNSSLIVYKFVGSTSAVSSTASVRENSSTNRNEAKVVTIISGGDAFVRVWNTGVGSRWFDWHTMQEV